MEAMKREEHLYKSMPALSPEKLKRIANQLRILSIRATTKAGSGHPTSCLSAADIVSVLFFGVMRYFPHNPQFSNNDRFVLSKGHAAPLLYAAWAEAGLFPLEELDGLRKFESVLEGHPTRRLPFVDVATGSLGHGLSASVGMALAARLHDLSYRTYVLLGDGESSEGSVWEAAAMASHNKLSNLVGIIDVNRLGQSQSTMYAHDLHVYKSRFEAFGWFVITVDGHDTAQLLDAFKQAESITDKPVMVLAKTFKGGGVTFLKDHENFHGKSLTQQQMQEAVAELESQAEHAKGIEIPSPDVNQYSSTIIGQEPPRPLSSWQEWHKQKKESGRENFEFPPFTYNLGEKVAPRKAYGNALVRVGSVAQDVVVLDGDVKNSTHAEKFAHAYPERYFECYIAEQNMLGVAMGISAMGKIPFVSSFAAFLTRAYDQIRMAGVSELDLKIFGSHVGVSIGQDGTSQMGLEDIAMMRAVFGSVVLYPSDAVSTEKLVEEAVKYKGIVYIRGTRPDLAVIYEDDEFFPIGGLKILHQSQKDQAVLVSAGVTLHEALKAYQKLQEEGISVAVVDLYSVKPLDVDSLRKIAEKAQRKIITVEDHYPEGGLGDAVASAIAFCGIEVHKLAVNALPHCGTPEELIDAYGIGERTIVEMVRRISN